MEEEKAFTFIRSRPRHCQLLRCVQAARASQRYFCLMFIGLVFSLFLSQQQSPVKSPVAVMPTLSPTLLRANIAMSLTAQETTLGRDVLFALLRALPASTGAVTVSDFPVGTVLMYTDSWGNAVTVSGGGLDGVSLTFREPSLAALHTSIESLTVVTSAANSEGYTLQVKVASGNDPAVFQTFLLPVSGAPTIVADIDAPSMVTINTSEPVPLAVMVSVSAAAEMLVVEFQVDSDENGNYIGNLALASGVAAPSGTTFTSVGNGKYVVEFTDELPAESRQAALDSLLQGGIVFEGNDALDGEFPDGIVVTAKASNTSSKLYAF